MQAHGSWRVSASTQCCVTLEPTASVGRLQAEAVEGRAEGLACHEPGSHSRDGIERQKRGYPETECFSKDVSQPWNPHGIAPHSCLIHELFNGVIYKYSVNPDRNY